MPRPAPVITTVLSVILPRAIVAALRRCAVGRCALRNGALSAPARCSRPVSGVLQGKRVAFIKDA